MKIIKIFILLGFFLLLSGCQQIKDLSSENLSTLNFKIFNKSKSNIDWIKIYMIDGKKTDTTTTFIEIYNGSLKGETELPIFSTDIKKYSKSGLGYFKIFLKKSNQTDVLSQVFSYYNNYSFSNDSFPNYNTFEVLVVEKNSLPSPNENVELKLTFSKYKGETKIEGY